MEEIIKLYNIKIINQRMYDSYHKKVRYIKLWSDLAMDNYTPDEWNAISYYQIPTSITDI